MYPHKVKMCGYCLQPTLAYEIDLLTVCAELIAGSSHEQCRHRSLCSSGNLALAYILLTRKLKAAQRGRGIVLEAPVHFWLLIASGDLKLRWSLLRALHLF